MAYVRRGTLKIFNHTQHVTIVATVVIEDVIKAKRLDNRWIVPYNAYLCEKYNCQINVEIGSTIAAIKYMYKYKCKGPDRATIAIEAPVTDVGDGTACRVGIDEVKNYLTGRYIYPPKACWRMLKYPMQWKSYAVIQLTVHLPAINYTLLDPQHPENIQAQRHTMLTRFFRNVCSTCECFDITLLRGPSPQHVGAGWQKCKATDAKWHKMIGRMVSVPRNNSERFYLRMLLCNVPGPTSFEDLRNVDGTFHDTFQAAAQSRGLLETDDEWYHCMEQASQHQMPG
ncbi:Helitron helicase [Phytophthora megakarya]|uniref:Helitron helicase n=1 Tax=Phytophthora megakarya TaxID=4795 RepID=A0A225VSV3_9STRA|nr:Helitron helicase [Phytophthora megakarya]